MTDHSRNPHGTTRRSVAVILAIVAVSCVGPHGLQRLLYPFAIFTNYGIGITENMSPLQYWQTVLNPMLLALPLMTALVLVSAYASRHDGRLEPHRRAGRAGRNVGHGP